MNKETSQDQTIWNNGFDFFFERREKDEMTSDMIRKNISVTWTRGFIAASNYCEHLLKEAKGKIQ